MRPHPIPTPTADTHAHMRPLNEAIAQLVEEYSMVAFAPLDISGTPSHSHTHLTHTYNNNAIIVHSHITVLSAPQTKSRLPPCWA